MTELDVIERRLRYRAPAEAGALPDFSETAARAHLLDVAYATMDTAVGRLLLASTPDGLIRIDGDQEEERLADLSRRVSPRVLAAPRKLDRARRELDEYLDGRRRDFELALDQRLMSDFGRRVLAATAAIPYGSTSTYGAIAAQAGSPRGSRAAGNALGSNPLPIILPCHRVLHAGGGLGGYTGGLDRKRTLLAIEKGQVSLSV
jgi:methylated-DNA-[protein]-cysteine S-methyltransferase